MLTIDAAAFRPLIEEVIRETLAQVKTEAAPERWLGIPEVATVLGLGQTKIREMISDGRLRSVVVDTARRIPESALIEFQGKCNGSK